MSGPATIQNGSNVPLTFDQGTVPNMSIALANWYQTMTFTQIVKTVVGFEVVETPTNTTFRGVLQPYTGKQMAILSEGERGWNWFTLHSDPVLKLQIDDVVTWQGRQIRIMSRKDYSLYAYIEYTMIIDWTGSGPGP